METISNDMSAFFRVYSMVTAPAQQHANRPSVYTALFNQVFAALRITAQCVRRCNPIETEPIEAWTCNLTSRFI